VSEAVFACFGGERTVGDKLPSSTSGRTGNSCILGDIEVIFSTAVSGGDCAPKSQRRYSVIQEVQVWGMVAVQE
jgi:hypothetical protein